MVLSKEERLFIIPKQFVSAARPSRSHPLQELIPNTIVPLRIADDDDNHNLKSEKLSGRLEPMGHFVAESVGP